MIVTPTICNISLARVLVDGGACLNLLSPGVFHRMLVGDHQLQPSLPFYGVTDGKTVPLGQIELPVTFGGQDNYHMVNLMFDVAEFKLPFNSILGWPALAKFMMVLQYAYGTVKILGPQGNITVKFDVKGAVHYTEKIYDMMVASKLEAEPPEATGHPPTKQRQSPN